MKKLTIGLLLALFLLPAMGEITFYNNGDKYPLLINYYICYTSPQGYWTCEGDPYTTPLIGPKGMLEIKDIPFNRPEEIVEVRSVKVYDSQDGIYTDRYAEKACVIKQNTGSLMFQPFDTDKKVFCYSGFKK